MIVVSSDVECPILHRPAFFHLHTALATLDAEVAFELTVAALHFRQNVDVERDESELWLSLGIRPVGATCAARSAANAVGAPTRTGHQPVQPKRSRPQNAAR